MSDARIAALEAERDDALNAEQQAVRRAEVAEEGYKALAAHVERLRNVAARLKSDLTAWFSHEYDLAIADSDEPYGARLTRSLLDDAETALSATPAASLETRDERVREEVVVAAGKGANCAMSVLGMERDEALACVEESARLLLKDVRAYEREACGRGESAPRVVCLCGSTRFMDWFHEAGWQETMAGKIVLSVGVSKHLPADHGGEAMGSEVAARLDELHLRKIDMADEVFVLNVGGYIGESTAREIAYAEARGKPVRYLEPPAAIRARKEA